MISAYDHPYKMVAIKIPYPFSLHPAFDPLRIELRLLLRPRRSFTTLRQNEGQAEHVVDAFGRQRPQIGDTPNIPQSCFGTSKGEILSGHWGFHNFHVFSRRFLGKKSTRPLERILSP